MLTSDSLIIDALIGAQCDKWRIDSRCVGNIKKRHHVANRTTWKFSIHNRGRCSLWNAVLVIEGMTTGVRVALWIRIITAGQLAELSWLTFCTFQLISMEPHSLPACSLERTFSSLFTVSFSPDSDSSRLASCFNVRLYCSRYMNAHPR